MFRNAMRCVWGVMLMVAVASVVYVSLPVTSKAPPKEDYDSMQAPGPPKVEMGKPTWHRKIE